MEQRTIDNGELRQWIDEWGEESHDDILPSDDEADIANRILEHHTRGEYAGDVDWNGAWESLRGIVGPALEHVHGFFPDGAETLARYVREIDMGIDPDTGEDLERAAIEEPAFRTSFRIRAMAGADPEDEPALDKVIQAADADYRHDVISGGDVARADWRNAAAYEWRRLMLEPHAPTDPVSDVSALAVIAVSMRYAPDATRAMIATDVLGPDMPTMGGLRDIIGTPEQDVPVDTLITDLVGQWPDATPDRDTLTDRDHAAWRILSPIQQNAPAPVEGHIYGLLGMLDHVEYLGRTGETGRMHAERALRFDPSDRFASAVLDTAPTADGSTGLAELADIAQDRGTIRGTTGSAPRRETSPPASSRGRAARPRTSGSSSPVRTWTVSRPITALNSTGTRFRAWAPASATGMRSNSPTTRWAG